MSAYRTIRSLDLDPETPTCGRCTERLEGDPYDVIALGRRYCSVTCALLETSGNYWYPGPVRRYMRRKFACSMQSERRVAC